MTTSPRLPLKKGDLFWILLSLLVLLPSVYYPYVNAFDNPDFSLDPGDWRVLAAPPPARAQGPQGRDPGLAHREPHLAPLTRTPAVELLARFAPPPAGPVGAAGRRRRP